MKHIYIVMALNVRFFVLLALCLTPWFVLAQTQIGVDLLGDAPIDTFGKSVSLSADGSILAIGGDLNDGGQNNAGHVRIYENNGGTWTQIGQDIYGENAGDRSGISVSLSSNGNIVAIGAWLNDANGVDAGHVRIYENVGGVWEQIGQDIDGDAEGDFFGYTVSLSGNGNIVAIGAYLNDGNGENTGHAKIFEFVGGNWTQIGDDLEGDADLYGFGLDISISKDGNVVAIGASRSDTNGIQDSGLVRVFKNNNGTWTQIGQDFEGSTFMGYLGDALSLSDEGNVLAIGVSNGIPSGGTENTGFVQVFRNQNDDWIQIGEDIPGEAWIDGFGYSVSISGNGAVVAIGARGFFSANNTNGYAEIYQNLNGSWSQIGVRVNGDAVSDEFGSDVSLSFDASTVAISAPANDANGDSAGQVKVFDIRDILSANEVTRIDLVLYPNPTSDHAEIMIANDLIAKVTLLSYKGDVLSVSEDINSDRHMIDLSTLATGVYLVSIETQNKITTKRIIKQ